MKNKTLVNSNVLKSYETLAKENVLTWEALKESKHFDSHCATLNDLAEYVAYTNTERTDSAGCYNGYNSEDWKSTILVSLMDSYEKHVAKYSAPRIDKDTGEVKEHNPAGYTYSNLLSKISDELDPYYIKEHHVYIDEDGKSHKRLTVVKETDKNGYEVKKKYKFTSGEIPMDPDDASSCCLYDMVESNTRTEDNMERSEERRISCEHLLTYFNLFAKHKSKGPLFAFIEDTLRINGKRYGLEYLQELFRNVDLKSKDSLNAAIHEIVNVYNDDLIHFLHFIDVYDEEFIKKHLARNSWEFVKKYSPKNEEDFKNYIYRFRNRYKKELAEYLGIELPHQERKKKSA